MRTDTLSIASIYTFNQGKAFGGFGDRNVKLHRPDPINKDAGTVMYSKGADDTATAADRDSGWLSSSEQSDGTGASAPPSAEQPSQSYSSSSAQAQASVQALAGSEAKHPPNKRSSYKKGRNKKPEGMPSRPLSAYNWFFKEQREVIIEERTQALLEKEAQSGSETKPSKGGRKKKPKRAKIGFEELAKIIGSRWKSIEPHEHERFKLMAEADAKRYKEEMEAFLRKADEDRRKEKAEEELKAGEQEAHLPQRPSSVPVMGPSAAAAAAAAQALSSSASASSLGHHQRGGTSFPSNMSHNYQYPLASAPDSVASALSPGMGGYQHQHTVMTDFSERSRVASAPTQAPASPSDLRASSNTGAPLPASFLAAQFHEHQQDQQELCYPPQPFGVYEPNPIQGTGVPHIYSTTGQQHMLEQQQQQIQQQTIQQQHMEQQQQQQPMQTQHDHQQQHTPHYEPQQQSLMDPFDDEPLPAFSTQLAPAFDSDQNLGPQQHPGETSLVNLLNEGVAMTEAAANDFSWMEPRPIAPSNEGKEEPNIGEPNRSNNNNNNNTEP